MARTAEVFRIGITDGLSVGPGNRMTGHAARDAEIAAANRAGVDAILLSPVFATRSHPGSAGLGPLRWRLMAARAQVPVIALGGMNKRTARRLTHTRWAAIDGLSPTVDTAILDAATSSGALYRPQQGT